MTDFVAAFDSTGARRVGGAAEPSLVFSLDVSALAPAHTDLGIIVPAWAGHRFVVIRYAVLVTALIGAATVAGAFDVGAVAPNYNEMIPNASFGTTANLNAGVGQCSIQSAINFFKTVAGEAIHLASNTPVTGPLRLNLRVGFVGYWEGGF